MTEQKPKHIYLTTGIDGETSWSEKPVQLADVKYIRADEAGKSLDKSYQYGVEAERKQHNWWGNFDNYHAHCINGEHFIGKNPGYGCDECKRVFGTGYTDSLTNQGETK